MTTKRWLHAGVVGVGIGVFVAVSLAVMSARQQGGAVAIDSDDIGGIVSGPRGPEAGVWVIAETTALPTTFNRIVVTDDRGRYVLPDLPKATYDVWVRGYGLVDSPKVKAAPGAQLNLKAVEAPNTRAAAEYYPAGYWLSLIAVPPESDFPGTGPDGNGISPNMASQSQWIRNLKSGGCLACHALGNKATREIPQMFRNLDSTVAAWDRRIKSGQAGGGMSNGLNAFGRERVLEMFADWSDRIAAGEVPSAPPRPQGIERNVVITQWDWADPKAYLHDEISTDKRNPRINANGPIYGALEASADYVPVLDPVRHAATRLPIPLRDPETPAASGPPMEASPYWGEEAIWTSRANAHNPMMDHTGRVWLTSRVRPNENPAFCREGSDHPSAKLLPMERAGRHLAVYDPKSGQFKLISTCYSTHHLVFAEDANHTLWTSGGGPALGWLNTKLFDETGDEVRSQGWTALILDTNGSGRRDEYVEPDQPLDPAKDKRISNGYYGIAVSPIDGSIWGSSLGFPGAIIRVDPGSNPPATALAELYELPADQGYSPRGMDIDRNGVVWAALASGHLASFDRRKCKGPLNGPKATGQHCPEGFAFYAEPLPQLKGVTGPGSAEASYYTWVDQFDTLGLGANVPINTGNESEALLALRDGQWVVLRVPYPLGFYTKWMDGRIDDPNGEWKGRGIWATYGNRTPFHLEGGKGETSKVVRFQMRPDPLAK